MKDIEYNMEFFSEWHCSSGLSAGADTDALVIKDADGLPYVPGKTVKGLLREAAEELIALRGNNEATRALFNSNFGLFGNKDNAIKGSVFITNAELSSEERNDIISNNLQKYLFNRVTSIRINDDGVAEDNSLRSMETVIPCKLHGSIKFLDESLTGLIEDAARFVKHAGVNRNRGLGRVKITLNIPN
jgi:CRISPR/Cas system CSM-associated protein Csm3 (group 7 of RAMP superfamily)